VPIASQVPANGVFEGVPWAEVAPILASALVRELASDVVLAQPGGSSRQVWFVLSGRLAIHIDSLDAGPVDWIETGGCAGELAALELGPRTDWIVTQGPCTVIELTRGDLLALLEGCHRFARNLLMEVARRARVANAESVRRQRNATVDGLTGLYNRRWLEEFLPRLVSRAQRAGQPLSLAMFDIDHFKRLNDTRGHVVGDHVLAEVARVARRRFRPGESVVRYGGEEFTVVLPDTDLEGAWRAADRLRQALASTGIALPDGSHIPPVTVSGGVAERRAGESGTDLLDRADQALYRAKAAGRDQVLRDPE